MPRIAPINPLRGKRILADVHTGELPVVLSKDSINKIERRIPVTFKTAALYCRKLGYSQEETEDLILKQKAIAIIEPIEE